MFSVAFDQFASTVQRKGSGQALLSRAQNLAGTAPIYLVHRIPLHRTNKESVSKKLVILGVWQTLSFGTFGKDIS